MGARSMTATVEVQRLHFPDGYLSTRGKHRAACHCGWTTTPRVSRERARAALLEEHRYTGAGSVDTSCGICGETVKAHGTDLRWTELRYPWEVFKPLMENGQPYVTPAAEGRPRREVFICRDEDACLDRYQAQVAADRLRCGCSHTFVAAFGHYHDRAATTPAGR